jgi:hypothetical protein
MDISSFLFLSFFSPQRITADFRGAMLLFAGLAVKGRLADAHAHVVAPAAVRSVASGQGSFCGKNMFIDR